MYPDTKRLRQVRRTICLDEYEDRLFKALAEYQGEQLGTLLRQLAVHEASRMLLGDLTAAEGEGVLGLKGGSDDMDNSFARAA